MISIVVVEDDLIKLSHIKRCLESILITDVYSIQTAGTATGAFQLLASNQFDLLILDLNIPAREKQKPSPSVGVELLRQIQGRRQVKAPTHVIGLTSYTELAEEYSSVFAEFTWTLVEYSASSNAWELRLQNKIDHIRSGKIIEADHDYGKDLAIITAVEAVELKRVLDLPGEWRRVFLKDDDTIYHEGVFRKGGRELSVVAANAIQMGMPATTALAMKICAKFRPRYLSMAGIAAGRKGKVGDILVAEKTWDYGSGKNRLLGGTANDAGRPKKIETMFEPAPTAIPLDAELVAKVGAFIRRSEVLREIEARWTGIRPKHGLSVQFGAIASGASVVENSDLVNQIFTHERKLVGVEMEAYGVFLAARVCPAPRPKAIVIKSICDFADKMKDDKWQDYAAFTSSQFLYEFALSELCNGLPDGEMLSQL